MKFLSVESIDIGAISPIAMIRQLFLSGMV